MPAPNDSPIGPATGTDRRPGATGAAESDPVLVAGVDSSTQSTKVVLVRSDTGQVVDMASAPHPDGTEVDPRAWWAALTTAGKGLLERAAAIGIAGQQHGMVALDDSGEPVRDALLWNDMRSAPQADEVVEHFGGRAECAAAIGSVPTASFTVTKLRWLAEDEPEAAARVAAVMLPHDWLTWELTGRGEFVTDHGDASGTGYYSPRSRSWLPEVAGWALGHDVAVPRLAGPAEVAGYTPSGAVVSVGTGDNMAAALGLGLGAGDVAVSIGTSGTAFSVADEPTADPAGYIAGFADATGRYLPLVCTINAARILTTVARLLGVDLDELSRLALAAQPGSGGLTLLPYLDGERTPSRPDAAGVLAGLTSGASREDLARAAVEALACSLADAVTWLGMPARRVLMLGGAARSDAVQRVFSAVLGMPVHVPEPAEYVAIGAARQAAWALSGADVPPAWPTPPTSEVRDHPTPAVRQRYGVLRDRTEGWSVPSRPYGGQ
jgi:xylulokinase